MKATERLFIRKATEDDGVDVWNIWSNEGNQKYMYDPVTSVGQVIKVCKEFSIDENNHITILSLKDTGEIVGTCSFGKTNKDDQWWLGYSIKEEHWGKGFASEAVAGVIELARESGVTNIISGCVKENIASNKVLSKNGFSIYKTTTFVQLHTNIEFESNEYKIEL